MRKKPTDVKSGTRIQLSSFIKGRRLSQPFLPILALSDLLFSGLLMSAYNCGGTGIVDEDKTSFALILIHRYSSPFCFLKWAGTVGNKAGLSDEARISGHLSVFLKMPVSERLFFTTSVIRAFPLNLFFLDSFFRLLWTMRVSHISSIAKPWPKGEHKSICCFHALTVDFM